MELMVRHNHVIQGLAGIVLASSLCLSGCGAGDGGTGDTTTGNGDTSYSSSNGYTGSGSLTQGVAETSVANLFLPGSRVAAVGTIDDSSNTTWTAPAQTRYLDSAMPAASDLYNGYVSGHDYSSAATALSALDGSDIVEVDASGQVITAYIFADNYFEMYVNGTPVGRDPVPYTEFNSNIVRFRVTQPFSVAMLLVDWEENLGTGTEENAGTSNHPGDGGMVAVFKDESGNIVGVTDGSWKAQTYYSAPVTTPSCLSESGSLRLSSDCSTSALSDLSSVYGVHWQRPTSWMSADYDDSGWPQASTYSNATVGVANKPAYTNFTELFDVTASDAQFIWSSNLVLDNEVLVRGTVGSDSFNLSSKALKTDMSLPLNATCDGANNGVSLPLSWSGAPAATQSFVLTMHHFPNPADEGDYTKAHSYWSVYDIPATTSELTGGETGIGVFGINSVDGQQSYAAPCSATTDEHEYTITLFALSAPVGSLGLTGSTTDLATLRAAIAPYTIDSAELTLSRTRYTPGNDDHLPTSVATTCAEKSQSFAAYSDYASVECSGNTLTVTTKSFLPYRSSLDEDKPTVGIQAWIGRVPVPQQASWTLPITPSYLSGPESNINIHHAIGVSVDGIPILHYAKEATLDEIAQIGSDYSDRDTSLLGEVDQCGGHAGNGEDYHYHTAPICLMDTHDPSQPLAYMFDGLPLYFGTGGGQLIGDGVNFGAGRYTELNYLPQKVKTGERPLDECNAYDLHGDGSEYVYYSTATAPYSIGCYRALADQASSVPGGPHWTQERDLAWSGDVELTDFDTMTFNGKTWRFNELAPKSGNDRIAGGNTALILYRQLSSGESGYDASLDCYAFRYRLDSSDTEGLNDTTATHCR